MSCCGTAPATRAAITACVVVLLSARADCADPPVTLTDRLSVNRSGVPVAMPVPRTVILGAPPVHDPGDEAADADAPFELAPSPATASAAPTSASTAMARVRVPALRSLPSAFDVIGSPPLS